MKMLKHVLVMGFLCLVLLAWGGGGSGGGQVVQPTVPTNIPGSDQSVDIPMPIRQIDPRAPLQGMGIPVTIAGQTSTLLLDSGASGVRIFSSAVGTVGFQRIGTPSRTEFADGTVFTGTLATAPVSIGSIAIPNPIVIQVVDQINCIPAEPDCPGSLGFNLFAPSGFLGILGTGMRPPSGNALDSGFYNPISRLPGNLRTGYIVRTGGFGSTQGTMTVGLTPQNTAGFNQASFPPIRLSNNQPFVFPDGTPAWDDGALRPAYTLEQTPLQNRALATNFDTGTSDIVVFVQELPSLGVVLPTAIFRSTLPNIFDLRIQVGSPRTPSFDRIILDPTLGDDIPSLMGMPLFFRFNTSFDIQQGRIGFQPR